MNTIRERIIDYLQKHPEGVDDDMLADALGLKYRQQANSRCRELEQESLVERRKSHDKIHNFWLRSSWPTTQATPKVKRPAKTEPTDVKPWFWEGNVQTVVVRHLERYGWQIDFEANTASRERGKDIVASSKDKTLWTSVKGYPQGTKKTHPSTQAGHWFKRAMFDILKYRGESDSAELGLALPDFPRYRKLAKIVEWVQPAANFTYYWVQENGLVQVER